MRTAPSWVITQRVVVISHRSLGTTYRSHLPDSRYWTETSVRYNQYSLRNNHRIAQFLTGTKHKIQISNFSVAMSRFTDLFLWGRTRQNKGEIGIKVAELNAACASYVTGWTTRDRSLTGHYLQSGSSARNQLPVHLAVTTHLHALLRLFRG